MPILKFYSSVCAGLVAAVGATILGAAAFAETTGPGLGQAVDPAT